MKSKKIVYYYTCGAASKKASVLVGQSCFCVLKEQGQVALIAAIHVLMVYLPYLLAKWLESLQAENISKKILSLGS